MNIDLAKKHGRLCIHFVNADSTEDALKEKEYFLSESGTEQFDVIFIGITYY